MTSRRRKKCQVFVIVIIVGPKNGVARKAHIGLPTIIDTGAGITGGDDVPVIGGSTAAGCNQAVYGRATLTVIEVEEPETLV